MATNREFLNHVLDCCAGMDVRARPMMGEYVLYVRDRVAGGLYDNCLMLKDVPAARACMPDARVEPPYPGARAMLAVDRLEDGEFMRALFEAIYPELPAPKAKSKRKGGAPERIRARLFALRDEKIRAFNAKLIPTLEPGRFIGVRTPALRALAKELSGTPDAAAFMADLPHAYFEENNLHGFLIEQIRDYDACVAALNAFLPHVDNWATCDQTSPKALGRKLPQLRAQAALWMESAHSYTLRYGIGTLMRWFLGEAFDPADLEAVSRIRSEEYYVNMMIAWYFATALALRYAEALPCIEERRLAPWTHNRAIQKALESDRVGAAEKAHLRTLKISAKNLS